MCSPSGQVGDTTTYREQALHVHDINNRVVPVISGDLVFTRTYVGMAITNDLQNLVRHFSITLTTIGP
jgi:hypothetical protein